MRSAYIIRIVFGPAWLIEEARSAEHAVEQYLAAGGDGGRGGQVTVSLASTESLELTDHLREVGSAS